MIAKFTGLPANVRQSLEVASWLEQGQGAWADMDVCFFLLGELPEGDARLDRVVVALEGLLSCVREVQASRRGVMSLGAVAN